MLRKGRAVFRRMPAPPVPRRVPAPEPETGIPLDRRWIMGYIRQLCTDRFSHFIRFVTLFSSLP